MLLVPLMLIMHGYFDANDQNPKVVIEIAGPKDGKKAQIAALFDTGHSGSLSLTIVQLIEIGAVLSTIGQVEYADGNTKLQLYFSVKVTVDNIEKEVDAGMIENPEATEAIAGLELFSPYMALIDFKNQTLLFQKHREQEKTNE